MRSHFSSLRPRGISLIEMLVAMAITLILMASVITLFANIGRTVSQQKKAIDLNVSLRQVRNILQQDLAGATCPTIPWTRVDSNTGYFEIIEGGARDYAPSKLTDGIQDSSVLNFELDPAVSLIPRDMNGQITSKTAADMASSPQTPAYYVANGLGDHDDILMFTSHNEQQPYLAKMPVVVTRGNQGQPTNWGELRFCKSTTSTSLESKDAEIIWFAVENPLLPEDNREGQAFFGEPGMRTIYRRVLLIAPWLDPYKLSNGRKSRPGVLRVFHQSVDSTANRTLSNRAEDLGEALAELIAFQDRYDISARLEYNKNAALSASGPSGAYQIVANTLADLTKPENRFQHHGYKFNTTSSDIKRAFPFGVFRIGSGLGSNSSAPLWYVRAPSSMGKTSPEPRNKNPIGNAIIQNGSAVAYNMTAVNGSFSSRPLVYIQQSGSDSPASSRVMLNDEGKPVLAVQGMVPLWGARRGEDLVLSNVLAFDLRVYDPGAPVYQATPAEDTTPPDQPFEPLVLRPTDPGWYDAHIGATRFATVVTLSPGAYVDLAYMNNPGDYAYSREPGNATSPVSWFSSGASRHGFPNNVPRIASYDTWSFHYEHDGVNQDGYHDNVTDQGTDGFDTVVAEDVVPKQVLNGSDTALHGVDDANERETSPPYAAPLRGIEVIFRGYDSTGRLMREVQLHQNFVPQ